MKIEDFLDEKESENVQIVTPSVGGTVSKAVVENVGTQNYGAQNSPVNAESNDVTMALNLFYSKLQNLGLNLDELYPVLETDSNTLILSNAGSGKTTTIILKLIRDLISHRLVKYVSVPSADGDKLYMSTANVLVSTFLKSGAQEIQQAFDKWCEKLNIVGLYTKPIKFKTMHAEFYELLKEAGITLDMAKDTSSILRRVLTKYGVRNVASTSYNLTVDELNDLGCIITYSRNRLDDKKYSHALMSDYGLDSVLLQAVISDYKEERRKAHIVDFEDLQELVFGALQTNVNFQRFVASRYDFIYLDEFQDMSQIQYSILKYYFAGAKGILAVGDDNQTIYSWRGSDINIIARRFKEDYHPDVKHLSVNYRCTKKILNCVIPSIRKNTDQQDRQFKALNDGGVVNIYANSGVSTLIKEIKRDVQEGRSCAVISRTNADLLIPAIALELSGGIEYAVSKSVGMRNRLPRQVFGVIDLLTKRYTSEFENFFKMFLPRYKQEEARNLASILKMNKTVSIYNMPERDLKYSTPSLYPLLAKLREFYAKDEKVQAYFYLLKYMKYNVFTSDSAYAKKACALINMTLRLCQESTDLIGKSIEQISELFNEVIPDSLDRRVNLSGKKRIKVKLTTVHEAKGKEWDSVYIWNDTDGVFPSVVGGRELANEEIEEERRVHYIAWTRARTHLSVFTTLGSESRFLKECDLTNADINELDVTHECKETYVLNTPTVDGLPVAPSKTILDSLTMSVAEVAQFVCAVFVKAYKEESEGVSKLFGMPEGLAEQAVKLLDDKFQRYQIVSNMSNNLDGMNKRFILHEDYENESDWGILTSLFNLAISTVADAQTVCD